MSELSTTTRKSCRSCQRLRGNHVRVVNHYTEIMSELSTTTRKSCRNCQRQHGNHVGVVKDYTEIMSELSTTTRISCRSCQWLHVTWVGIVSDYREIMSNHKKKIYHQFCVVNSYVDTHFSKIYSRNFDFNQFYRLYGSHAKKKFLHKRGSKISWHCPYKQIRIQMQPRPFMERWIERWLCDY